MTDLDKTTDPTAHDSVASEGGSVGSKLNSMVLGDTVPKQANGNVTNIPGLIALLVFFGFIGSLGWVYLAFVVALLVMIFLHELGHYMTAKWTGMKSTQFFLGFGPTIISRTRGEVEWGIKALPLGAFVRIIGMSNLDPVEPEDEHRTYRSKSYPRRMLVITAGSAMHFIQALILFVLAISIIGLENRASSEWSVGEISRLETGETPSVEAGIQLGDRIVGIDDEAIGPFQDLVEVVQSRPGEDVTLTILRDGATLQSETTLARVPDTTGGEIGYLGIYLQSPRERESIGAALSATGETFKQAFIFIPSRLFNPSRWVYIGSLIGDGREDVSLVSEEAQERPISVVGAVRIAGEVADFDLVIPVLILGSLNVFIGLFNLVPLLPLDGGHAAMATYERIRSRRGEVPYRADIAKMLPVTYVVVAFMLLLGVVTLYLDLARPITTG